MKKTIAIVLLMVIIMTIFAVSPTTQAAETQYILGVNAINTAMAEGHSLILTSSQGEVISAAANGYCWWRTVTFEHSDEAGAYIVTSISLTVGSDPGKNNYIPKDGFVLCVNIGNDYSSSGGINYVNKLSTDTYNNTANLQVGMKAWLTGIDIEHSSVDIATDVPRYSPDFTSNAKIYVGGVRPTGVTLYEPQREGEQLDSVQPNLENGSLVAANKDLVIEWEPIQGASHYIINVNKANLVPDGHIVVNHEKVTQPTYTLSGSLLDIGNSYVISITATGEGYRDAVYFKAQVAAASERVLEGRFLGKTIMAFGDSITARPGWVGMLYGELGVEVINAGVGGDSTEHAINRYQADVIAKSPDILFMLFGMNDQAQLQAQGRSNVLIEKYEQNYRTIIEDCLKANIDVILLTGNFVCTDTGYYVAGGYGLDYGTDAINDYYDVIRALAADYNLSLIDINEVCKTEQNSKVCAANDGVHLSTYGQELFTRVIADYMYNEYVPLEFPVETSEESDQSQESSTEPSEEQSEESSVAPSNEASETPANETTSLSRIVVIGGVAVLIVAAIGITIAVTKKR